VELVPWYLVAGEREPAVYPRPGALPDQHYQVLGPQVPHLEYALTWFSLAAALGVTTWLRLRPRRTTASESRRSGARRADDVTMR
jgi:cytochrome oxidase assembly protein ShyY1